LPEHAIIETKSVPKFEDNSDEKPSKSEISIRRVNQEANIFVNGKSIKDEVVSLSHGDRIVSFPLVVRFFCPNFLFFFFCNLRSNHKTLNRKSFLKMSF